MSKCDCVGNETCVVCNPEEYPFISHVYDMDGNRVERDLRSNHILRVVRAKRTRKTDAQIIAWYWKHCGERRTGVAHGNA